MIARAEASPVFKGIQWLQRNPLSDLRVQYGIIPAILQTLQLDQYVGDHAL